MKKARIDKLERIVIPINYRKNLDITTDTDLIIECSDGKIEIYAQKNVCKICGQNVAENTSLPLCKECIRKVREAAL